MPSLARTVPSLARTVPSLARTVPRLARTVPSPARTVPKPSILQQRVSRRPRQLVKFVINYQFYAQIINNYYYFFVGQISPFSGDL